eukprot:RCo000342
MFTTRMGFPISAAMEKPFLRICPPPASPSTVTNSADITPAEEERNPQADAGKHWSGTFQVNRKPPRRCGQLNSQSSTCRFSHEALEICLRTKKLTKNRPKVTL